MSNNERSVDFVIRAKNQSKRTLDEIRKDIEAVNDAIDEQVAASKRGEGSTKALDAAYRRLAEVTKDLTSQQKLLTQFEAQSTRLAELERKLTAATTRLREHQAAMAASEKVTKAQENTAVRLQKAVDRASGAMQRQSERIGTTRERAQALGLSLNNVDKAQDQLLATARQLVQANSNLSDSQEKFTENTRLAEAEARKLADTQAFQKKATEAQELVKASEYVNWWTEALQKADREEKRIAETQAFQKKAAEAQKLVKASEYVNWWVEALQKADQEEQRTVETKAFQKKAAEAQKLVKASEYVNWWVEALQKADQEEQRIVETQAFQEKAAEAQKLVKASEYVNWWVDALAKADVAEKRLADQSTLNQMADRAIAAARGYRTLGDASKRLAQNARPLSDTLKAINDPAATARQTLGGLEEEVQSLAATVAAAEGPIKDYREQVKALGDVQKSAVRIGGQVDDFQNEVAALRQARAEFRQAQAQVDQFAQSMRQADEPTAEMAAELKRLQANVASAGDRLATIRQRAREMQGDLRKAGVDTSKLASEQERLVRSAKTANSAMGQLTKSYKANGEAAAGAGKKTGIFRDEGRTTLSLAQRIRGEILALTASYLGLQGAIGLAAGSIDAFNQKAGIKNQLTVSADIGTDLQKVNAEFEYLRQQADRVGVSFESMAPAYAKFSASASQAGRTRQEIRYVAETFMEVSRVANLTADDVGGVFKAIEQIYSKGEIQAEELRGQLGDRIFGAFEVFAKALEEDFPDLDKAMEQGLVTSDYLVKAAERYRKIVAEALPDAMTNLAAQQARLSNEVLFFKTTIAEDVFADEYQRLVGVLTEFFRSEDGQRFAETLSDAFGAVVNVLEFLIQNLDAVEHGVKAVAFVLSALTLARGAEAVVSTLKQMNTELDTGTRKARILRGSLLRINAAVVGWQIGTWAREEFQEVERFGNALVQGLLVGWEKVKFGFEVAFNAIEAFGENVLTRLQNAFGEWYREVMGILADIARVTNFRFLAPVLDGMGSVGGDGGAPRRIRMIGEETEALRLKMEAEVAEIIRIFAEMDRDMVERRKGGGATTGPDGTTTDAPDITPGMTQAAELELIKARADAEIAASRRATDAIIGDLQRQEQEMGRLHQQSLIATDQYYAERGRIAQERLDAEIGFLQENLEALNQQQAETVKDEIARQTEVADVQAKIVELTKAKGAAERQFAHEAQVAREELSKQAAELENSVLEAQGNKLQAQLNRNQAQYDQTLKTAGKLSGEERARFEANAQIQKSLADQEATMAAAGESAEKMAAAAQAAAAYMDAMLESRHYSGQYTDLEAMRAEGNINAEKLRQLEKVRDAYLEMGEAGKAAALMIETEMMKLAVRLDPIADMIREKFEDAFGNFFENLILKGMSAKDAFRQLGFELATEFAKMWIKEATQQLMKFFIKNSVFKFLSGMLMPGNAGMDIVGAGQNIFMDLQHTGGLAGAPGGVRRSNISPTWFAGAPRYHTGGLVGLKPDEYPAILQKNEEVLTTGDPRHVFNQGAGGGTNEPVVQDVSVNNYVDAQSFMSAALATQQGRKMIMNVLQSERTQLRSLVGK